jgi:O-antigen/teichoic acid export membrane protein
MHMHEVVHGAAVALAVKLVAALIGFTFHVMLARVLGAKGAGQFVLALTCVTLATVMARVGLDNVLVRLISTNSHVGNWRSVHSIWRNSLIISVPASVVSAIVLFCASDYLAIKLFGDQELGKNIAIMALSVPFWALTLLHSEMLRGLKHIGTYQVLQGVVVPGIALVGLYVLVPTLGIIGAATGYVIATTVAMLAAIILWQRAIPAVMKGGEEVTRKELLHSSLPLLWSASMFFVNGWIAIIVLGVYGTPTEVAFFNATTKLAWLTSFVLLAVNSILASKFATIYKTGTIVELERTAIQTTRLMALLAAPVLMICMLTPSFLLELFGGGFSIASSALQVLVIGQTVNVLTGSVGQILMMTGHEKDLRNVITSSALLNTLLAIWLTQYFGLNGVAWSVAITTIYTSIASSFLVHRRLGISVHIFRKLVK